MSRPMQQRPTEGYRFGRYLLVRPLGVGGMAQVWLARKEIHGGEKVCAVKMPADLLGLDAGNQQALLNEIHIASQLSHSNIVQVFDAGIHRGVVYMELERIDGVDLEQLLDVMRARQIPMKVELAVYIWSSVLEALHYACTYERDGVPRPVIHRDLNPSNVLVSSSGEVKVMDFGIAKMHGAETSGDHIKGKPRYMPPEQIQGRTSTKVDLFGAAAMFWEMVEGQQFRHEVPRAQIIAHALSGAVPQLKSPEVDDVLRMIYARCTHPDPERRPANPDEVLSMLARWSGRVERPSALRDVYAWQLEARRHSGYTNADVEIPPQMFKLVEILRAIDAQDAAHQHEAPIVPKASPDEQIPDAPSFVRRPRRSSGLGPQKARPSDLAPTEDGPIPGRPIGDEPVGAAPAVAAFGSGDRVQDERSPMPQALESAPRAADPETSSDRSDPKAEPQATVVISRFGSAPPQSTPPLPPTERLPTAVQAIDDARTSEAVPRLGLIPAPTTEPPPAAVRGGRSARRMIVGTLVRGVVSISLGVLTATLIVSALRDDQGDSTALTSTVSLQREATEIEAPVAGPTLQPVSRAVPDVAPSVAPPVAPPIEASVELHDVATPSAVAETASAREAPADAMPSPTADATSPKPQKTTPKPKAKPTAPVEVRLAPHFAEGELRIDKKTWTIKKTIDIQLAAGKHTLAWRRDASEPWQTVEPLRLQPDRLYTVRVGTKGPLVSSSAKEVRP